MLRERFGWEVGEWMEVGRSESDRNSAARSMWRSLKLKRLLVAEGEGLSMDEGMFFRKSRYAEGGVMGVLSSSFFSRPGDGAMGLMVSEGKVPEAGVCNCEAERQGRLSKPAAAMVAVDVAEAMGALRRRLRAVVVLRERETERSNE